MQIMHGISHIFRNKLSIGSRHTDSPHGELSSDLDRRLYGMGMREQSIVKQIFAMAGDDVFIQQDTFAIDEKNHPCYLETGRKVRLSKSPLTFDREGDVRINILDESDKFLSMRLSDYIEDIYANR
jgi:hypothetical protein